MFLVIAFPSYCTVHLLTYYWPKGAPMQRRSQGAGGRPPNDEKVGVRETVKTAIKSIHWKVSMK